MPRHLRVALPLAALFLVTLVTLVTPTRAQAPPIDQLRPLQPAWNLVVAAQDGDVEDLVAGSPQIISVYRWDAARQAYESWLRAAPPFLNTLRTVAAGDGLWVRVTVEAPWPLPTVAPTRVESGVTGWRLVGWTDVDTPASEVASRLGAVRLVGFDAMAQQFRAYDPSLSDALNTLPLVRRGDAVWGLFSAGEPGPVALEPALGGRPFDRPIELGAYPAGRLFVAEQDGIVLLFDEDGGGEAVLLDLRDRVSTVGNEEGLLSLALDPRFVENGHIYVYYSIAGQRRSRLSRFTVASDVASLASELALLEIEQPFRNHNGGAIRFGPDGLLYLGLGDGGAGGDPEGNGQNRSTLLGSILRIDVRGASAARPYQVPSDNPFVGAAAAGPEIWAYGFRNPWRMAFDPSTGALWVGDVGQNEVEEVDIAHTGGNYGWNRLEGDRCFSPPSGCDAGGTVAPVATYDHDEGCSITGGVVYRGSTVAGIAGAYLYGDFCSGRIWGLNAADPASAVVIAESGANIASFGVDADGEVYVLTFGGPVLRVVPLE